MAPIASLMVEIGSNITGFKKGLKQVDEGLTSTAKRSSFLSNTISTGLGVLGANIVTKLADVGSSIISTGFSFNSLKENAEIAFTTMLGSGEGAKKFLNDLSVFAEQTPFELPGLIQSAQKLTAFGFSASKVIPMLTNIGDATAGLGGSPELLNRITLALGQIKAKGKVQADEMLQLTEAGIPAWDILAEKLGVTVPKAMEMTRKGMVNSQVAIDGLLEGMNRRFGGLMEKQSQTWSGVTSTLKDKFRSLSAQALEPFFKVALKGLQTFNKWTDSETFKTFFANLVSWMQRAADFASSLFDVFTSKGVLQTLELLWKIFAKLGITLAKLVRPFTDALGGLFRQLAVLKTLGFGDLFDAVVKMVKKIFRGLGKFITHDLWPMIKDAFAWLWNATWKFFTETDWGAVWQTIKDAFAWLGKFFTDTIWPLLVAGWDLIMNWLVGPEKNKQIKDAIANMWQGALDWFATLWELIGPKLTIFWQTLVAWFKGEGPTLTDVFLSLWDVLTTLGSFLWSGKDGNGGLKASLTKFWGFLVQWMKEAVLPTMHHWRTSFIDWAENLWEDGLKPKIGGFWMAFESWISETFPRIETPLDNLRTSFLRLFGELGIMFDKDGSLAASSWNELWDKFFGNGFFAELEGFVANIIDFVADVVNELANLVRLTRLILTGDWARAWEAAKDIISRFWSFLKEHFNFNGPDSQFVIGGIKSLIDSIVSWFGTLPSQLYNLIGNSSSAASALGTAIKDALFASLYGIGDSFTNWVINPIKSAMNAFIRQINNLNNHLTAIGIHAPQVPEPFPGYATGGLVFGGNTIIAGENGPEMLTVPNGTRVRDRGQTAGYMSQNGRNRLDIVVKTDQNTQVSRDLVNAIAKQLQRDLSLQGRQQYVYTR